MEISGKIIVALPEVGGTSKAGNTWKKREYVLETQETYPRKIFFNFFNERADQYPLNVGETYTISFDIESREFNGRWYTDISAFAASEAAAGAPQPAFTNQAAPAPASPAPTFGQPMTQDPFSSADNNTDDLPF